MIFKDVTGTSTSYTPLTITDSGASFTVNFFRGWTVTIDSIAYEIESNTATTLTLTTTNNLSTNSTYTISFLNRSVLSSTDDKLSSLTYFPNILVTSKINQSYVDFEQKIYSKFRYMIGDFDDGQLPQDYIYNLFRIKQAMIYYCLELLFVDQSIQDNDFSLYKAEYYKKKYKEMWDTSITLLTVDVDKSGEYSNGELSSRQSSVILLDR